MKQYIKYLALLTLIFFIPACGKEKVTNPDSAKLCSLNFETHPHNEAYQKLLDDYVRNKGFVGITLLVDSPDAGLWVGSSGFADIENGLRMNPCHLHHVASIYKSYLAVVLMQLVEAGKLSLDDTLEPYLSADLLDKIPNGKKARIRDLMAHRSGIPEVFDAAFVLDFFNNPGKSYSIEELLEYVQNAKPLSEPGTDFFYSDANYALLSLVVNKLDGDYQTAIRKRVFEKTGATESWIIDEPSQAPAGLAASYWDRYGDGLIENVSDWQIALSAGLRGTDGIITSADDMKRFMQGLNDGTLVSANSLSQMTEFKDIPADKREQGFVAYGLGLGKVSVSNENWFGHFGSHVGSGAIALYNPARKTTLVVFQNKGTFFSDSIKAAFFAELIQDVEKIAF
jgi:D-alanyl-D-alanine carboxypeptidase